MRTPGRDCGIKLHMVGCWDRRRELSFVLNRCLVQPVPADYFSCSAISVNVGTPVMRAIELIRILRHDSDARSILALAHFRLRAKTFYRLS